MSTDVIQPKRSGDAGPRARAPMIATYGSRLVALCAWAGMTTEFEAPTLHARLDPSPKGEVVAQVPPQWRTRPTSTWTKSDIG
jgi:hypothetical protein